MKKAWILLIAMVTSTTLYGQQNYLDILISHVWKTERRNSTHPFDGNYRKYERDHYITFFRENGEQTNTPFSTKFYFSDEYTEDFDFEKVGKTTSGKYMITYSKNRLDLENINVYEILKLTPEELVIKNAKMEKVRGTITPTRYLPVINPPEILDSVPLSPEMEKFIRRIESKSGTKFNF